VAAAFNGYGAYVFTALTQYTVVYAYNPANPVNVDLIGIAANRDVVGNFTGGYAVQRFTWATAQWQQYGGPTAIALDVNEAGDVVMVAAAVSGGGIYRHAAGGGWSGSVIPLLYGTGVIPGGVVMDETGAIWGDFGGFGFWRHA
jgi:hypothetical protein